MSFNYEETLIWVKDRPRLFAALTVLVVSLAWKFVPVIRHYFAGYLSADVYHFFTDFFWLILLAMGIGTLISLFLVKSKYHSFRLGTLHFVIIQKNGETIRWAYEEMSVEYDRRTGSLTFGLKDSLKSIDLYVGDVQGLDTMRHLLIRKVYDAGGVLGGNALISVKRQEKNKTRSC